MLCCECVISVATTANYRFGCNHRMRTLLVIMLYQHPALGQERPGEGSKENRVIAGGLDTKLAC